MTSRPLFPGKSVLRILVWSIAQLAFFLPAGYGEDATLALGELEQRAETGIRTPFRAEGIVCAISRAEKLIVLQDLTSAVIVELPAIPGWIERGDSVAIQGAKCIVSRTRCGPQISSPPVLEADGIHGAESRAGDVQLDHEFEPIRVVWFNRWGPGILELEFEGPGVPRQHLAENVLCYAVDPNGEPNRFAPGLTYEAFVGRFLTHTSDLESFQPVTTGIASKIDAHYVTQAEDSGLIFTGFLHLAKPGVYRFHIVSDDGSYVQVGWGYDVVPMGKNRSIHVQSVRQAAAARGASVWAEAVGIVNFAAGIGRSIEMELETESERIQVAVIDATNLDSANLLGKRLHVTGVLDGTGDGAFQGSFRLLVPTSEELSVEPSDPGSTRSRDLPLKEIDEVRRLSREQAEQHIPVQLDGVVTCRTFDSLVLQGANGGIYAEGDQLATVPKVGENWQIEGYTRPGRFSPMIRVEKARYLGRGVLPEPVRPTWDQLIHGTLDNQYVELEGVPLSSSGNLTQILTRYGKLDLSDMPLETSKYIGSRVRIRGCIIQEAEASGRVRPGVIKMGRALISVEEAKPVDPFAIPPRPAADLLHFDPNASALRRVRLNGQVIHVKEKLLYIQDGATGFRVACSSRPSARIGEIVDVVGFSRFESGSLTLHEAELRSLGMVKMPPARALTNEILLHGHFDSTLVEVEGSLMSFSTGLGEHLLEIRTGGRQILARMPEQSELWHAPKVGDVVKVAGVYRLLGELNIEHDVAPFDLLLNGPEAVTVTKHAPFWTTRHTLIAGALLISFLGIAAVWIVVLRRKIAERAAQLAQEIEQRQIAEQRRLVEIERSRVARDLHDELGAGLTEITMLGTMAASHGATPDEKEASLAELAGKSRELIAVLDEIVWAIDPKCDSVDSLATYYSFFTRRFLSLAGIACRLQVAESIPCIEVEASIRHGLFLGLKEALNNLVRHSKADEAILQIEFVDRELRISLQDNGRGFVFPKIEVGRDGLVNMEHRIRNLGGSCKIESLPGSGTKVSFAIRIERKRSVLLPTEHAAAVSVATC